MKRQKCLKEQMSEISWSSSCELLGAEEGALSYMGLHATFLFIHVHFKNLMHLCVSAGRRGFTQNMSKTTSAFGSPVVRPYHLFVGTPLPVSGNSSPFHRELSIIPHRIRDKDERPSEGESSRGGIACSLRSWWTLWSLSCSDSSIHTLLHDSSGEDRLFMDVLIHVS